MGVSPLSNQMKEESPKKRNQNMQKLRGKEVNQGQKSDQCGMKGEAYISKVLGIQSKSWEFLRGCDCKFSVYSKGEWQKHQLVISQGAA